MWEMPEVLILIQLLGNKVPWERKLSIDVMGRWLWSSVQSLQTGECSRFYICCWEGGLEKDCSALIHNFVYGQYRQFSLSLFMCFCFSTDWLKNTIISQWPVHESYMTMLFWTSLIKLWWVLSAFLRKFCYGCQNIFMWDPSDNQTYSSKPMIRSSTWSFCTYGAELLWSFQKPLPEKRPQSLSAQDCQSRRTAFLHSETSRL